MKINMLGYVGINIFLSRNNCSEPGCTVQITPGYYYDNHDKIQLKTVTRRRRGKKYISETVFRRLNMR